MVLSPWHYVVEEGTKQQMAEDESDGLYMFLQESWEESLSRGCSFNCYNVVF